MNPGDLVEVKLTGPDGPVWVPATIRFIDSRTVTVVYNDDNKIQTVDINNVRPAPDD